MLSASGFSVLHNLMQAHRKPFVFVEKWTRVTWLDWLSDFTEWKPVPVMLRMNQMQGGSKIISDFVIRNCLDMCLLRQRGGGGGLVELANGCGPIPKQWSVCRLSDEGRSSHQNMTEIYNTSYIVFVYTFNFPPPHWWNFPAFRVFTCSTVLHFWIKHRKKQGQEIMSADPYAKLSYVL